MPFPPSDSIWNIIRRGWGSGRGGYAWAEHEFIYTKHSDSEKVPVIPQVELGECTSIIIILVIFWGQGAGRQSVTELPPTPFPGLIGLDECKKTIRENSKEH